jgi:S1-C subfamily serine protease
MEKQIRKLLTIFLIISLSGAFTFGFLGGVLSSKYFVKEFLQSASPDQEVYFDQDSYEDRIIGAVKKSEDSVISIIATKDLPVLEEYYINPFEGFFPDFDPFNFQFRIPQYRQKGTEPREVSSGTGFIIDPNGYIVTNRHVVEDTDAHYTVLMNDGKKYSAEIIARDAVEDFAVLKIDKTECSYLVLGDSNEVALGQTAIAIGNALGEFRNTVSIGVVSGLARSIQVFDNTGKQIILNDVIQTDAAINRGNSGGPLLNLNGQVIGINTAMVSGAQNIGFAIPVNKIKKSIEQAIETGKIKIPYLGVRYVLVTPPVKEEKDLLIDYGALLIKGSKDEPAVEKDSPADKASLQEGDIILEVDGQKIDQKYQLATIIRQYNVNDTITLKVFRNDEIFDVEITLDEYPTN